MSLIKPTLIASLALATAVASMGTAEAKGKKTGYFVGGALATALVLTAVKADECKKWKRAYNRTGNPKYLDRYYACM